MAMGGNVGVRQPVVLGAKTRLAKELITLLQADPRKWSTPLLLARNIAEADQLRSMYASCEITTCDQCANLSIRASNATVLFCCALGAIHPTTHAQPIADLTAVQKELECVRSFLGRLESAPLHLVFVSTILAVSSGVRRYQYSGWKRLLESALHDLSQALPNTPISVVYPGRLVDGKRSFSSSLSTSYGRAAKVLVQVAQGKSQRKLIGIDSRLFLVQRGLATIWTAISGQVR